MHLTIHKKTTKIGRTSMKRGFTDIVQYSGQKGGVKWPAELVSRCFFILDMFMCVSAKFLASSCNRTLENEQKMKNRV